MKKKNDSRILNIVKSIINIRYWIDFERMKVFTLYLVNGFKKMFIPQQQAKAESFESVLKRLNISETALKKKQSALYRLSWLMCTAAFLIFSYAVYQMFYGSFKAAIVSIVVTVIALVLAFRYHFWYFQIKERKLGCSIKEWYRRGLMGDKK